MATASSPAQLEAALWARPGVRVHALIDGLAVPDLPQRLGGADVLGWDCLARGALDAEAEQRAPHLADLKRGGAFAQWLLFEATQTFPGWGLLLVTQMPLLAVRQHCRALGEVSLPDGTTRDWRWYDPGLFQVLAPGLSPGQLDEVFADDLTLVVPAPAEWTWYAVEQGLLVSTPHPLLAITR